MHQIRHRTELCAQASDTHSGAEEIHTRVCSDANCHSAQMCLQTYRTWEPEDERQSCIRKEMFLRP